MEKKNYKKTNVLLKTVRAFKIPIWPNATDAYSVSEHSDGAI